MQKLKRVGWQIGQPLLPVHLIAQEDSLLSHLAVYIKNLGLPYYGIGHLLWDETLLSQGVLSIHKLTAIFPNGDLIDFPENSKINSLDLNVLGVNQVTVYLHLLKEPNQQEMFAESLDEEEKVNYSVYNLVISNEHHLYTGKINLKLAEFERDVENRWKLLDHYSPPLYSILDQPFLVAKLSTIRTILESLQKELELESTTGKLYEQRTLNSKFCLMEVARFKQYLMNVERNIFLHPYFLYEQLTALINCLAIMHLDLGNFNLIPYQHEKQAPLFSKLIEQLIQYLKPKTEQLSSIQFEKKQNCYVSQTLPQDLRESDDIYFVIQSVDPKAKVLSEGLKLAAYNRLFSVHRFALNGIVLLRLESAPFNNNFSRQAQIYKVDKDSEWDHALSEGKIAFSIQGDNPDVQGFLYWR